MKFKPNTYYKIFFPSTLGFAFYKTGTKYIYLISMYHGTTLHKYSPIKQVGDIHNWYLTQHTNIKEISEAEYLLELI